MFRLLAILTLFTFFACKNNAQKAKTPATPAPKVEAPKPAPAATPNTGGDQAIARLDLSKVPAVSASKKAYFTSNYWACFGAQHPNNDAIAGQYLDVKLQFFEDMTFKMYRNKDYVFTGNWAYDDAKSEVYLSSDDQFYNSSFKTKDAGMRMIWIGNTEINKMGVQMRWDNHQKLED